MLLEKYENDTIFVRMRSDDHLNWRRKTCRKKASRSAEEKFGLLANFEVLTEMGSGSTDWSIPVGLRKIVQRKVVETAFKKKTKKTPTYR